MSIATAISNAQAKVAAAYTALRAKGATMPLVQNLTNMPTAINSIQTGGSTLPYDAEVEYLQSDGAQYIDTGVVLTKNYAITIDCAVISGSNLPTVIGAYSEDYGYSVPLGFTSEGYPYTQIGDKHIELYTTNKIGSTMAHYICVCANSKQYLSDSVKIVNASIGAKISSLTLYLLARHRSDTVIGNYATAKIGKVRIIIGGTLMRDYSPVRVGTVGYMYDSVSGQLFGNAGTGNFILGPDV